MTAASDRLRALTSRHGVVILPDIQDGGSYLFFRTRDPIDMVFLRALDEEFKPRSIQIVSGGTACEFVEPDGHYCVVCTRWHRPEPIHVEGHNWTEVRLTGIDVVHRPK